MKGKFAILEKLKESPFWQKLGLGRIALGHAAFFPDVDGVGGLVGPDAPLDIIGGRQDLTLISQWVDRAFAYWAGPGGQGRLSELGAGGVATVRRILARVSTTRPLVSARLVQEEQTRIELTERQAAILGGAILGDPYENRTRVFAVRVHATGGIWTHLDTPVSVIIQSVIEISILPRPSEFCYGFAVNLQ